MNRFLLPVLPLIIFSGCAHSPGSGSSFPGQVLQAMRADTGWIRHLDSLSQTALGPGARCIDSVSHTFSYDGRTWLFNQDWGGVLEIPSDYIVEDDPVQAELSFHGTRAFSPDSLILVSFYAGFQCVPDEESRAFLRESLTEDGFTVISWDVPDGVVTVRARSPQGINYFGRHLPADGDGVERAVSVQYPDGKTDDAKDVLQMAIRYPAGPHGNVFRGEAL